MENIQALIKEYGSVTAVALIIFFGSIVHATAQLKLSRDKKKVITGLDFIILLVIASFSGVMFGLGAALITKNLVMILIISGAGAFLGLDGLNRISNVILDAFANNLSNRNK